MTRALLIFLALVSMSVAAQAQLTGADTKPGDACTAAEEGYVRRNASADRDTSEITLICDGTVWQKATGGGLEALQGTVVTGPCTAERNGLIKFNAGDDPPWQYCDGGTTTWLPFKLPQCQDDDAGECALALSRSSNDPNLVASSIRCGQNILGVTGTYDCTTDPAAFSFTDVTGQNTATLVASNTLTPTGYTDPRPVSVTGQGSPQVSINGGAWVTSGWMLPGYTLQARLTSASAYDTPYSATVSIGGVSDTWSVRTKVQDTTPDAFNFTDQTNVQLSTLATSASITPTGYDGPVTVSVSGQGSPQVSINGGAWGSGGNINPGETLAVRLTSSAAYLTTLTATVTVGGTSDSWSVQTRPDVTVINITGNQANVNLFTLAGSPAAAGNYEFVIAAGAIVYSTSTATAALTSGALPPGSTVKITNNGTIYGMGGNGGGSDAGGYAGGPALSLNIGATINNTNGYIFGGGGGGSGGSSTAGWSEYEWVQIDDSYWEYVPVWHDGISGGSGGGGASGLNNSSGGNPGTVAGPGAGQTNAASGGTHGAVGGNASGSGGAAGKAINLNGNTVNWLGGNNATQVKGAVN